VQPACQYKPRVAESFADTSRYAYIAVNRCHLQWSDQVREVEQTRRNRINEKELEKLVVVLFAKVEIFQAHDAVGPAIRKTAGTPASPSTTQNLAWVSNRIVLYLRSHQDTGTKSGGLSKTWDDLWLLGSYHRQSAKSGNCFLLRSDKLLLIPLVFTSDLWIFPQRLSISISWKFKIQPFRRFNSSR